MTSPQKWNTPESEAAPTPPGDGPQAPVVPSSSSQKPQLQGESQTKGLEMLLRIEAEARRATTVAELSFLIANETQKMARSRQIFVLTGLRSAAFKVSAISAVSQFDKKSALVEWVEDIVANLVKEFGGSTSEQFMLPELTRPDSNFHQTYPFSFMLWVPLRLRDNSVFGGILLARENPWSPADNIVADRLADTYSHAWSALVGAKALKKQRKRWPAFAAGAAMLLIAAGFYPVPMSVLAPLEVAAVDTKVIAAPIDGIVEGVLVDPNAVVKAGDPIIQMSDTALRNEHDVAMEELSVSKEKLKQVMQAAVSDPKMLREIAIARAEVDVKKAQLDFSSDMLKRSRVTAPVDGVAVFTDDANGWESRFKPVSGSWIWLIPGVWNCGFSCRCKIVLRCRKECRSEHFLTRIR